MSKLKIADLSFFETELNNSGKIKGGISHKFRPFYYYRFLFPVDESDMEVLEESVTENGSKTTYFYDEETDSSGIIVSKETETGKVMSVVAEGTVPNGRYASSSALAMS